MGNFRKIYLAIIFIGLMVANIPNHWNISSANFERYMTVTTVIEVNNEISNSDEIILGAFVEDECRGFVSPVSVGGEMVYFLMVYSNNQNEVIEFKLYNTESDFSAEVNELIQFESNQSFGSPDNPYLFSSYMSEYPIGDYNMDGSLNVIDLVGIVDIILNNSESPSGVILDYNGDGELNVIDVIALVNIIVGQELSRKLMWVHDGVEWKIKENRGNAVTNVTFYDNYNDISIHSDGDIAGIQFNVSGEFEITQNHLPSGWELNVGENILLIFSSDGSNLTQNKLFEYEGVLNINSSIASDWYGNDVDIRNLNVPSNFSLHSPYPNPFNPSTNIEFSISNESHVEINIYDVNGNLIENLLNSNFTPGIKTIEWDASSFSSGIYIIKMMSGEFTKSQKLVLVK